MMHVQSIRTAIADQNFLLTILVLFLSKLKGCRVARTSSYGIGYGCRNGTDSEMIMKFVGNRGFCIQRCASDPKCATLEFHGDTLDCTLYSKPCHIAEELDNSELVNFVSNKSSCAYWMSSTHIANSTTHTELKDGTTLENVPRIAYVPGLYYM